MRPKTKDVKKITLYMDEREWALLDALARLNHCSATALVERWTREKAAEEGLFEAEVERERIARDLHDNLAQQLSLLKIQCHTLFDHIPSDEPEMEEKIAAVSERIQSTIANVRHLAYNLRPPTLEQFGIVRRYLTIVTSFQKPTGSPLTFILQEWMDYHWTVISV